jgi:arylsulfatase A-like enzyme
MKGKKTLGFLSLIFLVVAAVFIFYMGSKNKKKRVEKPNIVLIVSDALRRDALGCYGGDIETPHIDWLAENGVLFENAYTTAPATMPASVAMLTGTYSRAFIVSKDAEREHFFEYLIYVNDTEELLAEILKKNGYDVKMDVENPVALSSNSMQGFERFRYVTAMSEEDIRFVENTLGMRRSDGERKDGEGSVYSKLYDLLYYVLKVPEEKNFFILKWFIDPHCPHNPPSTFRDSIHVDFSRLEKSPDLYTKLKSQHMEGLSDYEYEYIYNLYKAEVESVDERVGFILNALKLRGLWEKTIVIFTADHGEAFGEHGIRGHSHEFYEVLVKIPLIIAGPGIQKGSRAKTVVSHLDLMPTLKDLTGTSYEEDMQGRSNRRLLSGKNLKDRIVYFDRVGNNPKLSNYENDALLMNGQKLIARKSETRWDFSLHDLSADPSEKVNLAEKKPEIVRKMLEEIFHRREENRKRLGRNIERIGADVDLDKIQEKTLEELKALGYIK